MTHPLSSARRLPLLAAALMLCAGVSAQSQTVTIAADRDNSLFQEGDLSNGVGTRMFSGQTFADVSRRAFVHFPVRGAIPAGSTIRSVDLQLEVVMLRIGAPATGVDVHRATSNWGEGTSFAPRGQGTGAPATDGDTTWTHSFYPNVNWTNPGGDFNPRSSAAAAVNGMGPVTIASTAALVADVQAMLDGPASNFGFVLIGDERTIGSAVAWATHEDQIAANRPALRVTYDPPGAAATVFGSGCSTVSPFAINPVGVPAVGNQNFAIQATGTAGLLAPTASFALAPLANSLPLPVTGCPVWIDPSTIVTALGFPQPSGTLGLPIPNDTGLLGARLYLQGLAAGPGGGPVTANGIELLLGV